MSRQTLNFEGGTVLSVYFNPLLPVMYLPLRAMSIISVIHTVIISVNLSGSIYWTFYNEWDGLSFGLTMDFLLAIPSHKRDVLA